LASFAHICFIASTLDCLRTGDDNLYAFADELDKGLHGLDENLKTADTDMSRFAADPDHPAAGRAWLVSISSALAICTIPIIVRALWKRGKYLYRFFRPEPDLHKLLPNT
jgi:hypothetical protein